MLVSHRYRFIYLKTKKTASTSTEVAFEQFARPAGWTTLTDRDEYRLPESVTEAGIVGARSRLHKRESEWSDHMTARAVRSKLPREVWDGYFKFCNVRNPWDKTVSMFYHKARQDSGASPEAFRAWLQTDEGQRAGLDRAIYWIGDTPAVDDVINYHDLPAEMARIGARLGVTPGALPNLLGGYRPKGAAWVEHYDDAAIATVAAMYADEIAAFGWTFSCTTPRLPERGPGRVRRRDRRAEPGLLRREG